MDSELQKIGLTDLPIAIIGKIIDYNNSDHVKEEEKLINFIKCLEGTVDDVEDFGDLGIKKEGKIYIYKKTKNKVHYSIHVNTDNLSFLYLENNKIIKIDEKEKIDVVKYIVAIKNFHSILVDLNENFLNMLNLKKNVEIQEKKLIEHIENFKLKSPFGHVEDFYYKDSFKFKGFTYIIHVTKFKEILYTVPNIQSVRNQFIPNIQRKIILQKLEELNNEHNEHNGGNAKIKKINKKVILGKERAIYKKPMDRKEYIKHKGGLITVKEYKNLLKK